MKITKRKLRRIIKEMHPRAGVDNAIAAYLDFVEAEGHITPASSSVIASYFISKGNWSAPNMRMLGDQYGIALEDIQREIKTQREEMAVGGLSQLVPELTGGRRSSWQVRKEKELGESVKITKRQLRRIIREEKNEGKEVNEGTDMEKTRFGQSLVPGKQVAVNMSGKSGAPEVMATVESEPDWSNGTVEVKVAEGDEAGKVMAVPTDRVWEPETNEGKRVYNRDDSKGRWGKRPRHEGRSRAMRITKRQLRRIIREEKVRLLREQADEDIVPGDYLEIMVSDDGYETTARKVNPAEYKNQRSYSTSLKVLVRVEQVAEIAEDY